jgi:glycosyltransferase involved in cell wall biosynthesis
MKLVVISHKPCWRSESSPSSPTGYATDGGFPIQMRSLAELFDGTTLLVPVGSSGGEGGSALAGPGMTVVPLTPPRGRGAMRKLLFPFWILENARVLWREVRRADAVHAPIPGDVGTAGILLSLLMGKRLFVRHCGNWLAPRTAADRFWKWLMESIAGGRRVMLATGGSGGPPSSRNEHVAWVFASSLTRRELEKYGHPRDEWRREGQGPRLLIACRQERDKGVGAAIGSLLFVRREFPGATLDVVGDGSALPELRTLAAHLGLGSAVAFHGRLDHEAVLDRMSRADLFCYPTVSSDGFPKVVLEALACGLPVVATRVSVLPRLLEDEDGAGVLIDESTPEAVADGVRSCLADPERYRSLSRRAVATARSYSLETWRDAIGERLAGAWGSLKCAS